MEHVTNEMLAQALIVIKRDLDDLKPIPTTGPLTWRQAERLGEMDPGVEISIKGNEIVFKRKTPFGEQIWSRPYAREKVEFPLKLTSG